MSNSKFIEAFNKVLSPKQEIENSQIFELIYRGSSVIDKHYTKPMLPWIISEIKNQHKTILVNVLIKNGVCEVSEKKNDKILVKHNIGQIHKCVIEQSDKRCFLYTLRPESNIDNLSNHDNVLQVLQLQPSNIDNNQNYHCHLYQALTQQEVQNFFSYMQQQPRDSKPSENSPNSLADLTVHTESQFFEVLYVGRVKVSHLKVPVTFIDEALQAFKEKEKRRKRNLSGSEQKPPSPNRLMTFQHEGSGYSVPNIKIEKTSPFSTSPVFSPGTIQEQSDNSEVDRHENVKFGLWQSTDSGNASRQNSTASDLTFPTRVRVNQFDDLSDDINDLDMNVAARKNSKEHSSKEREIIEPTWKIEESDEKPLKQMTEIEKIREAEFQKRPRSGSTGSVIPFSKYSRVSETDLKELGNDFNRTMLFHIGHREVELINPELKSVQLHKPFNDIAACSQGVKSSDHFGFICREMNGNVSVNVGYIFRCDNQSRADEIMQVLNRSFAAMQEAIERERKDHLMCDFCPFKWFAQLCSQLEGLPAQKAHHVIMKKIMSLSETDRELIIAKFEGVETSEISQKNNILMMLLRTHFEHRQSTHSHPSRPEDNFMQRTESQLAANLEQSLKKAKQSITTSFSQLLKKRENLDSNAEKENQKLETVHRMSPTRTISPNFSGDTSKNDSEVTQTPDSYILEGVSDSPLKPLRQRSSTVAGADGESVRKELLVAKKESSKLKEKQEVPSAKINMFLKIGTPASPNDELKTKSYEDADEIKPLVSFRQSILKKVESPAKGAPVEKPSRKISTGVLQRKDEAQMHQKRSLKELMMIWKKSIFQQIILIRIERESQRLRELQKEADLQRVRLNYDEDEVPSDSHQTWEMLLSRPHARIDPAIICAGIKQGIPKAYRGEVWQLLMLQNQKFGENKKLDRKKDKFSTLSYEEMIKELTSHQHAILIDLGRTFPSHPYFAQTLGPGQLALFNILKAYSIFDTEVGYCQGLSFVGAIILQHLEEEPSFNLLMHLMVERGLRKHYLFNLQGLQVRMYQLSRLLHDRLRALYDHLEEHEVTPQLYAAPWFLTLFSSQFPTHFVVRVFDLVFLKGVEAVFNVVYLLLLSNEAEIISRNGFEDVMQYIKEALPNMSVNNTAHFFDEVCDLDFKEILSGFEVEYKVLKEELFFSQQQDDAEKLKEANKNLKRQNIDLVEQLRRTNNLQLNLQTSNQTLLQSQHHLEVRVRWLEMERNNMRELITILAPNVDGEVLRSVPPKLNRYLVPQVSVLPAVTTVEPPPTEKAPRQSSWGPTSSSNLGNSQPHLSKSCISNREKSNGLIKPILELDKPKIELTVTCHDNQHELSSSRNSSQNNGYNKKSDVTSPSSLQVSAPQSQRSVSFDHKAMREYLRSMNKTE